MITQRLYIDGEWADSVDQRPVHDPYGETQVGTLAVAPTTQVTAAAERSSVTGLQRATILARRPGESAVDQRLREAA